MEIAARENLGAYAILDFGFWILDFGFWGVRGAP